jgi:hypothetical protein
MNAVTGQSMDDDAVAVLRRAHELPAAHGAVAFAPARGALRLETDWTVQRGGTRTQSGSHWVRSDVFDAMDQSARRAHARAVANAVAGQEGAAPFVPPFSWHQVDIARRYAALFESHSAGGVRCASLEAGRGGSGGGSFIDAYIAEGDQLGLLWSAIGSGVAMSVRRLRPSQRGDGQVTAGLIRDRTVVDCVCLHGLTLSEVLARHGWSGKGAHRNALRVALCGALDRMFAVAGAFC